MSGKGFRESDLAQPVCGYLAERGFKVRSEVKDCDIAAVRDGELVIVELKRAVNLALLAQAAKRQRITDSVYVAVPRPSNMWKWNAQNRDVRHLLRRLEIGLIFVSFDPDRDPVEVAFHPGHFARRKTARLKRSVLEEIEGRTGDFNRAGCNKKKLVTAYRENAIRIACFLSARGNLSPRALRESGTGPKTLSILMTNVYGWFERKKRGVYGLSARGKKELEEYHGLAERYLSEAARKTPRARGRKAGKK
jgi:hypothetical protein